MMALAVSSVLLVIATPFAAAVSMGPLGDVRAGHWSIWIFWIGFAAIIAALASKWLKIGLPFPLVVAFLSLVLLVAANDGGYFQSTNAAPGTASIVGGVPATGTSAATAYSTALHEPTSDITFKFQNAYNKTSSYLAPAVALYRSGTATEKQAVEGSGFPEGGTGTATAGAVTMNWQSQVWGCELDVHVDLASYYEDLMHIPQGPGQPTACAPKDSLSHVNDITLPPLELKAIGTFDIDNGGTSLTCAAGADCIYSLKIENTGSAAYLKDVAVQVGTLTNATINSVDSSSAAMCSLELNANNNQYIRVTANGGEIGPLGSVTCNIHVSRAAGSSGGSFVLTGDDLYRQYDAPAFVTNTNIRSATASSALTVSFA